MSVRRENRTAGGASPGGLPAKLNHDRRNHELLKQRLATHAPRKESAHAMPNKNTPTEGMAGPGGRAGTRGKGRGEGGPKSFLRPTSSSVMKAAGGAVHATAASRRLDSNRRHHPQSGRKVVAGDAPSRRAHAPAAHLNKEETDSFEAKQQEDSLPETHDKDRRDTLPPTPSPEPPSPASTPPSPLLSTPVVSSPSVTPPGLSPPSSTTTTPAIPQPDPPLPPAPSPPRQAPPSPTPGPQRIQEGQVASLTQVCARPALSPGLKASCPASREAVLRGVRARVGEGGRGGGVDADKDVCEAAAEDEEEFYRVRVRTRLVSYDNSTLVIRNTSRTGPAASHDPGPAPAPAPALAPAPASALAPAPAPAPAPGPAVHTSPHPHSNPPPHPESQHEAEAEPATFPGPTEEHHPAAAAPDQPPDPDHSQATPTKPTPPTPPSPLVDPSAVAAPPVASVSPAHTLVVPALPLTLAGAGAGNVGGTGAGAEMKRRLTLLVRRGKNFLAGMYSATQSRLEHYVRPEAALRPVPPRHAHTATPPLQVEVNPLWLLQHASLPTWGPSQEGEGASVPLTSPHTPEDEGGAAGAVGEESVDGEPEEGAGVDVVGVQVDEEWIKKNILCTCRCRLAATTSDRQQEEQEAGRTADQNNVQEKKEEEEEEEEKIIQEKEEKDNNGDSDDECLCYCSCHEGSGGAGLPDLPTEIQELLDADHARMWWTITGNFGNILPIDWSKTYTRQQYLPVLNLNEMKEGTRGGAEEGEGGTEKNPEDGAGEEEEEEVAQDLDLHHLILNGLSAEPVKSAEEVIQEIDDIMQEGSSSEDECVESTSSGENMQDPPPRPCPPHLYLDKLKSMSVPELNEALMELELVIRQYSETLITQLALRDELEYEKELKNSFISLLLQVQNRRRNYNVEKKKQKKVGPNGTDPKYLTTVIPYDVGHGPPHNPTLQILIKILTAINEDSPTVPTLLTDYILKVLCPS